MAYRRWEMDPLEYEQEYVLEMTDEENNSSINKVLPFIHQGIINEFLCMLSESYKEDNKHAHKIVEFLNLTEEEIFSFLPYEQYRDYLREKSAANEVSHAESREDDYDWDPQYA